MVRLGLVLANVRLRVRQGLELARFMSQGLLILGLDNGCG